MSNTLRRVAAVSVIASLLVALVQLVGAPSASAQPAPSPCFTVRGAPSPLPCEADGQVFVASERVGGDEIEVRFGFRNGDQGAFVQLTAQLPAELAAEAHCRLTEGPTGRARFDVNNIPIDTDGTLALPPGPLASPSSTFEITCRAPQVSTCGLLASINVRWLDLSAATGDPVAAAPNAPVVFSADAQTQVSPVCESPEALAPVHVRLGITAEAMPHSVPRGGITTWNVTVTNHGNRIMGNAVITDRLHDALEPPRTLPDGARWDEATRTLRLPVPSLAPGESTTISFPTQVRAWSQVPNTISVRSGRHTATAHADVFGLVDYFS